MRAEFPCHWQSEWRTAKYPHAGRALVDDDATDQITKRATHDHI
jgi:hypothetical protein